MTAPTTAARPAPAPPSTDDRSPLSLFAVLVSLAAFLVAALGLVVVATKDDAGTPTTGRAESAPIAVSLSEFAIAPAAITAAPGAVKLRVTNTGTQVHNLQVVELAKRTSDFGGGKTEDLDLGDVAAGTYQVICTIPGHADAGMKATLTVTAAGATPAAAALAGHAAPAASPAQDWAAMEKKMQAGMKSGLDTFTKGNATKGKGNQRLAPTIDADGVKEFSLEASIVDWETEPGRTVKAWAYNGQVPGPWIRVEPGDAVRVKLKNSLPVTTDIHFHGITTPFDQDGVAPLTQPYVDQGATFTYAFTVPARPELGMYHAHDHGNVAVLNGMFAVFQVGDVPLPRGKTVNTTAIPANLAVAQELPIVLNDAGVIGLSLNGKGYPATDPVTAKPGDWLLVHYYNEGLTPHPMHLHHLPVLVVAKDGFPLDAPYYADTVNVAPGERYSVLINVTAADVGVWAWHCHILNHAENENGLFGMVTALIVADPNKG